MSVLGCKSTLPSNVLKFFFCVAESSVPSLAMNPIYESLIRERTLCELLDTFCTAGGAGNTKDRRSMLSKAIIRSLSFLVSPDWDIALFCQ